MLGLASYDWGMEQVKIVVGCILAAVVYGIVHDQFTARICVEYFTWYHPPVFVTTSPTLLGLGWGIIATWWAGAIIGLLLVIASRFGSRPKFPARLLFPFVIRLMLLMATCAIAFGAIGYFWGTWSADEAAAIPVRIQKGLRADLWAHSASYACGFVGGLTLCGMVWVKRRHAGFAGPAGSETI
jgi:hypothetical protein